MYSTYICIKKIKFHMSDEQKYTKVVRLLENVGLRTKKHTRLSSQQKGHKKYKGENSSVTSMTERKVVRLANLMTFGPVEV